MEPHERAAAGLFLGFQYPVEIPGVSYAPVPAREPQFAAPGARRGRAFGRRVHQARARAGGAARHGRRDAQAAGQRRLFGRREEARRDGPDGHHAAAVSRCSTRPTAASTSTRCAVGEGINRIMRAPDKGVLLITHYERLLEYVRARPGARASGRPDHALAATSNWPASSSAKAMRRRRHDRALPHPQAGGMALRRPRRVEAGVGAVRRAADAHRRAGRELRGSLAADRRRRARAPGPDRARKPARSARIFVLNTAPVYGRIELEVSLAEGADFELYRRQHRHAACRPTRSSPTSGTSATAAARGRPSARC